MKKLLAGLFLLGSMLAFAAGEQRVPIEKMELNQQTSLVYVQGQQIPFTGTVEKKYASGKLEATMEFKDGKLNGKYIKTCIDILVDKIKEFNGTCFYNS